VGADPAPEHSVRRVNADRPVVQAHASQPQLHDPFGMKRLMSRIAFEQAERWIG